MRYLNLGCGNHFNLDWINVDFSSTHSTVLIHDLTQGIPFLDDSFDAVYHSHLLEHLSQKDSKRLICECFRVLKPTGVLRVVVPDLEAIAKYYLNSLEQTNLGFSDAIANYDWMMLELYDQTVRIESGGEMRHYLTSAHLPNPEFIYARLGLEFEQLIQKIHNKSQKPFWKKITDKKLGFWVTTLRVEFAKRLVKLILGQEGYNALSEGLFRQSGEIHHWMYDHFSLRRLLENSGFSTVKVCNAYESNIPDFSSYQLDLMDGKIRKPDSLFMEGIKP